MAIATTTGNATNNKIIPGHLWCNDGLPVDLGNDGPTPNGSHAGSPGPNNWLPYPVITASSGNIVTGTACVSCTVYFFIAAGSPAGKGGGSFYYLDFTQADGVGNWSKTLVAVTAADLSLVTREYPCSGSFTNTSEMSPRPVVYLPVVLKQ